MTLFFSPIRTSLTLSCSSFTTTTAVHFSKVHVSTPARWMWQAQVYMVSGVPVGPLPHSDGQKAKTHWYKLYDQGGTELCGQDLECLYGGFPPLSQWFPKASMQGLSTPRV